MTKKEGIYKKDYDLTYNKSEMDNFGSMKYGEKKDTKEIERERKRKHYKMPKWHGHKKMKMVKLKAL